MKLLHLSCGTFQPMKTVHPSSWIGSWEVQVDQRNSYSPEDIQRLENVLNEINHKLLQII